MEKEILNLNLLYDYNLERSAERLNLKPAGGICGLRKDLIDKVVDAQREEVRRCRILAEKEEELFPENGEESLYRRNRDKYKYESERLEKDEFMKQVQTLLQGEDANFEDKWFVERYNECIRNGGEIKTSELNQPVGHIVWDALLPSLAAEQLDRSPCKYMVSPTYDGVSFRPRVRMFGEQALVIFCTSVLKPQGNLHDDRLSFSSFLLQKKDGLFEVLGGYEFPIDYSFFDTSFAKIREEHNSIVDFDYVNEMVEPAIWSAEPTPFYDKDGRELPFLTRKL